MPGGHIEAGESPKSTLVRELKEELGIIATALEYLGTFEAAEKYGPYKCHVFLVIAWQGNLVNRQPEEHSETGWVTPEDTRHLELADAAIRNSFNALCSVSSLGDDV